MDQRLRPSNLVPEGFIVEHSIIDGERESVSVHASASEFAYSACGAVSRRVQSRYWRHVADLPLAGRRVDLVVMVRRIWCRGAGQASAQGQPALAPRGHHCRGILLRPGGHLDRLSGTAGRDSAQYPHQAGHSGITDFAQQGEVWIPRGGCRTLVAEALSRGELNHQE